MVFYVISFDEVLLFFWLTEGSGSFGWFNGFGSLSSRHACCYGICVVHWRVPRTMYWFLLILFLALYQLA